LITLHAQEYASSAEKIAVESVALSGIARSKEV
jgi:hypothetical protein